MVQSYVSGFRRIQFCFVESVSRANLQSRIQITEYSGTFRKEEGRNKDLCQCFKCKKWPLLDSFDN